MADMQAHRSLQTSRFPLGDPAAQDPTSRASANGERAEGQQNKIARLRAALSEGLPTIPSYVFELNGLLSTSPVDLKRVGEVIRRDPGLTAQVLRMCSSTLLSVREKVSSIEHAVILLGTERLRSMVLTISLVEHVGSQLSASVVRSFWQHSFLTAIFSERIARRTAFPRPEQAYLAGLLHDIGTLPLLTIASRSQSGPRILEWLGGGESIQAEQKHFGLDHCEVGRWIGISWNFAPALIDVFQHHHHPQAADRNFHLVGIVAAADQFCLKRTVKLGGIWPQLSSADPVEFDDALRECLPSLSAEERIKLAEVLESDSLHLIQMLELGNPRLFGSLTSIPFSP
jgi:HD-like signal output (HDOD) protein